MGTGTTWHSYGITTAYDAQSYVTDVTSSDGRHWWHLEPDGYDELDRPVEFSKGQGFVTTRQYRDSDQLLTDIVTRAGTQTIQDLSYDYDGLGNLTNRSDGQNTEAFGYDELNRLTHRNGTQRYHYEPNGNLASKADVSGTDSGIYAYGDQAGPHAVTSAWGKTYDYDDNGNLTGRSDGLSVTWTGFDKPRWMEKGGQGSAFLYDAGRRRVAHMQFDQMAGGVPSHYTKKKLYIGGSMEVDYAIPSGGTALELETIRLYVPAPDGIAGAMDIPAHAAGSNQAFIYHHDHLGSIESITPYQANGPEVADDKAGRDSRYSYDPWGERRDPLDWQGPPATTTHGGADDLTPRGYTGHEMLDHLGLIHMNGRIYDPLLGRFLSADLVVQTPGDLQSYNRYSYVRNNPLRYTDPTGFQAQNVDDAKKELERARKREAERRTRGAAIDRHGVAGVLLENNAIINAGESAATTTNSAASTAQPARTPKTEKTDATSMRSTGADGRVRAGQAPNSEVSPAAMPANNDLIGGARAGQPSYQTPSQRLIRYNQALLTVMDRLPGLVGFVTSNPRTHVMTNSVYRRGTSVYPEAVGTEKGSPFVTVNLTINKNMSGEFIEAMIVHGFTHAAQHLTGTRIHNEYDAYRAQWEYESAYHGSVLPVFGRYLDASGAFRPEADFNASHLQRTGQAPNQPVTVRRSDLEIVY